MKNLRIILITNILSPDRLPTYNILGGKKSIDFKVIFLAENEKNRKWKMYGDKNRIKFQYDVLPGIHLYFSKMDWGLHFNYGLFFKLIEYKPDVIVVTGYESPAYWAALVWSKIFRKKFVLWSGSTLTSGTMRNFFVNSVRKIFIKNADAYLSYGTLAKEFLIFHGAQPEKIIVGCNAVDVEWLKRENQRLVSEKERIKKQKGFPRLNILFSGQLIPRKGLPVLLDAFHKINNTDIGLIVLGEGHEKEKYQKYCSENKIKNVFFEGYQPPEKLPEYYAIADVFVLPSQREVWGLVVNEAMVCRLPVICSEYAGIARDLMQDGVNGYIFNPHSIDSLFEKLQKILFNETLRRNMGEKAFEKIVLCTSELYAQRFIESAMLSREI